MICVVLGPRQTSHFIFQASYDPMFIKKEGKVIDVKQLAEAPATNKQCSQDSHPGFPDSAAEFAPGC